MGGVEGGQSRAFQLAHGPQTPFSSAMARTIHTEEGINITPWMSSEHSVTTLSVETLLLIYINARPCSK